MMIPRPVIFWIGALVCATFSLAVNAQSYKVYQGGQTPSRGHMGFWMNNALVGDAGGALNGKIASIGITPLVTNTQPPFCINDQIISDPNGYHQLCVSANALGSGGTLTYAAIGGASNTPLTISSGQALAFKAANQQIVLSNLPPTAAGDVPVCIDPSGTMYLGGPSGTCAYLLTDDSGVFTLTDDTGTIMLTAQ